MEYLLIRRHRDGREDESVHTTSVILARGAEIRDWGGDVWIVTEGPLLLSGGALPVVVAELKPAQPTAYRS